MKQLIQDVFSGKTIVVEVPVPQVRSGQILVRVASSAVSPGTERMVVEFSEKNLLEKAYARQDLVRQALEKARRDGILNTLQAVQNRLDQPMALGYSCSGTIIGLGAGVSEFQVGDRVACAGGGYAVHAEVVSVPCNLVVKLPENVDFESAAFSTLGAIALQGIRIGEVKIGEVVAVIGLGLLGQLGVQILKAAGCAVIAMDILSERAELAHDLGADAITTDEDQLEILCRQFSAGHGADAILITADTKSSQPVEVAGKIAREKAIVVAVGAVGMTIPRKIYYEKELDFRISRSYGPGRYDPHYEERGHEYPIGYVRWTERRNMQAFVQLLAKAKVNVKPLITHRFSIDESPKAYELIGGKTNEPFLSVLITYPEQPHLSRHIELRPKLDLAQFSDQQDQKVEIGLVGAGNFASAILLPAMKKVPGIEFVGVCTSTGISGRHAGDKFTFRYCTTDENEIYNDPGINTVVIATRHHLHAKQVIDALKGGKHVFVEKPLCLNEQELKEIISTCSEINKTNQISHRNQILMVGFNRRFAPFVVALKKHLQGVQEPLMLHYRVNAGYIPTNHWAQDFAQSGGRLLGEACHFIDLLIFLAGSKVQQVTTYPLADQGHYHQDNFSVVLEFINGSIGTVTYVANGNKSFGKEYLEVFGGGLAARLDDYNSLEVRHGRKKVKRSAWFRQNKGHYDEWQALSVYLSGKGPIPMTFDEIFHSTEVTLAAQRSLGARKSVVLNGEQV